MIFSLSCHLHIRVKGTLEMLLIGINTFCSFSVHLLKLFTVVLYTEFVWFNLHSRIPLCSPLWLISQAISLDGSTAP